MGEHRTNPTAIAAAQRTILDEVLGFNLAPTVELNKEKLAEVVAIVDAAKESGQDPRQAVPKWNPKDNPEFFDYVVYNVPTVGRPSALSIRQDQIPTASIRWSEHFRCPLTELKARADAAFAGAEERAQQH